MEFEKTVLIVDDKELNRVIIRTVLSKFFNVLEASSGIEALEILKKEGQKIELMLLDLVMPDMSGFEVLEKMRSDLTTLDVPVIVISARTDPESEFKALDLGAADMIVKPFDPRIVLLRVQSVIKGRELEQMRIENALLKEKTETQLQLQMVLDNMQGGFYTASLKNDVVTLLYANDGTYDLVGIKKEFIGTQFKKNLLDYLLPEDREEALKTLHDSATRKKSYEKVLRIKDLHNKIKWILIRGQLRHISEEECILYIIMIDVTSEKQIEEDIRYRAEHDSLTGIYKRSAFFERTEKLLKKNPDKKYIIMMLDIQRFKIINEFFGEHCGDELLCLVAKTFEESFKSVGTYGRMEADHFVACIPKEMFDKDLISNTLNFDTFEKTHGHKLTYRLGIYEITDKSIPVSQMCDCASLALENIEGLYDTQYAIYDKKLGELVKLEQELLNEMQTALDEKQFKIFLQPIYSLSDSQPVSAEALVRWQHPEKGIVSPNLFIPVFERNGFISKLDYYIWDTVCAYQKQRLEANENPIPISVNISRMSLYNDHLSDDILQLIRKYDLEPRYLKLEITESAYNDNPTQLLRTMKILQDSGFIILMDDFGSGYSSLNTLKDIPVDTLKIDMKFMEGFETSNRAGNILTSVVRMAKWLGLPVIAEGVETKTQVDFLRSIGCESIQGYYFSEPLPIPEFEKKIKNKVAIEEDKKIDKNVLDFLLNGNEQISEVMNKLFAGLGIYELVGNSIEVLRVNDGYYKIFGYTPQGLFANSTKIIDCMHKDDVHGFFDVCRKVIETEGSGSAFVRRYDNQGNLLYLDALIQYISGAKERAVLCIVFSPRNEK